VCIKKKFASITQEGDGCGLCGATYNGNKIGGLLPSETKAKVVFTYTAYKKGNIREIGKRGYITTR
jgi:hypothetical protein